MLKPLADRVVLKMTKAEETTKSGIILKSNVLENRIPLPHRQQRN